MSMQCQGTLTVAKSLANLGMHKNAVDGYPVRDSMQVLELGSTAGENAR